MPAPRVEDETIRRAARPVVPFSAFFGIRSLVSTDHGPGEQACQSAPDGDRSNPGSPGSGPPRWLPWRRAGPQGAERVFAAGDQVAAPGTKRGARPPARATRTRLPSTSVSTCGLRGNHSPTRDRISSLDCSSRRTRPAWVKRPWLDLYRSVEKNSGSLASKADRQIERVLRFSGLRQHHSGSSSTGVIPATSESARLCTKPPPRKGRDIADRAIVRGLDQHQNRVELPCGIGDAGIRNSPSRQAQLHEHSRCRRS